jgi:hypothetical protein
MRKCPLKIPPLNNKQIYTMLYNLQEQIDYLWAGVHTKVNTKEIMKHQIVDWDRDSTDEVWAEIKEDE